MTFASWLILTPLVLSFSLTNAFAASEKELEQAARKEGVLQVGSNKLLYSDVLLEAFSKRYPFVKIRHDRFNAASEPGFDVFESKDPEERVDVMLRCQDQDMPKWLAMNWLADLNDLPNWKLRPRHLEDDKRYVYFIGSPHVLAYNPQIVSEAELPNSYAELTDSKWKDKIVFRNPLAGNSPAFFVHFIRAKYGEGWLKKFGKNAPLIAASGPALHNVLAEGGGA